MISPVSTTLSQEDGKQGSQFTLFHSFLTASLLILRDSLCAHEMTASNNAAVSYFHVVNHYRNIIQSHDHDLELADEAIHYSEVYNRSIRLLLSGITTYFFIRGALSLPSFFGQHKQGLSM